MTLRQLLSPQARAALFDPPTGVRAIVRHYTFSIQDVALIRQRRRNANRLGFAVHLAYLRFPGRVLGPNETPPVHLLAFVADQLRINPKAFEDYAQRDETRREHLAELQAYLGMRPFSREDYRTMAGNTLVLMATTSGRPNRSRMGFGRCEIPAPRSSMLLSVRFGTNSAMTPKTH
jgi:TnpA family transposase